MTFTVVSLFLALALGLLLGIILVHCPGCGRCLLEPGPEESYG